jgi:hypothetical protein
MAGDTLVIDLEKLPPIPRQALAQLRARGQEVVTAELVLDLIGSWVMKQWAFDQQLEGRR